MDIYNKYIINECNNILHKYLPIDLINIIHKYLQNNFGTYNNYLIFTEKYLDSYFSNKNISKIIFNYYNNILDTASLYYNNLNDYIRECKKNNNFTIYNKPKNLYINNIVYFYKLTNYINLKELYNKIKLDKNKICLVQYNNKKKSIINKIYRNKRGILQMLININNTYVFVDINDNCYAKIYGCNKNYVYKINSILKQYINNIYIKNLHISEISCKIKLYKKIDLNNFKNLLDKININYYINTNYFLVIYISSIHKIVMYKDSDNLLEASNFDDLIYLYYFIHFYLNQL
jgi:hypothetical protein